MKEIKLRVWDKNNLEMIYSDSYDEVDYCFQIDHDGVSLLCLGEVVEGGSGVFESHYEYQECKNCIIEQYTGLKDKNGKEIYEHDLLNHPAFESPIRVYWDEEDACFDSEGTISEWGLCEVIGNIHENPELLSHGK